ncbi:MAG: hypothetical protein MRQ09_06465 [Candidatus Midichloria sp.]|nr:hypothetical protein [Candidatus Midichloria sp.]
MNNKTFRMKVRTRDVINCVTILTILYLFPERTFADALDGQLNKIEELSTVKLKTNRYIRNDHFLIHRGNT